MENLNQIKLIACDLDGTLLLNGAQDLQANTCDLIRALQNRGVLFFAASGRQYTNLQKLFLPIKDDIGYLCENGALSFCGGKRLHKDTMPRELGQELIREIWDTDGAEVLISGEMVSYIQPKKQSYYHHMKDVVKNDVVVVDDIFSTSEDYLKISLYEEEGLHDESFWQHRFSSRCTVVTGGASWLDMMPKGVNKASGLRHILRALGIDSKNVMAIGDNDNDREMLELVGYPVAMKTAKPHIRAIAREETDTVEHLFERLLSL